MWTTVPSDRWCILEQEFYASRHVCCILWCVTVPPEWPSKAGDTCRGETGPKEQSTHLPQPRTGGGADTLGSTPCSRRLQAVVGILHPGKLLAPDGLVGGDDAAKHGLQLLTGVLRLSVALW